MIQDGMRKGDTALFVTFEGCEGCGKTTVINALKTELEKEGLPVMVTHEPGGSPIAEQIRAILLDKKNTAMTPWTEALLYTASRSQHIWETLHPAYDAGYIILSDRYQDSSVAYQGYARHLGKEFIDDLNRMVHNRFLPDITFFLDLEPKKGLERIAKNRGNKIDRLDAEKLAFHQDVYAGYQDIMEEEPWRIVRIDASQPVKQEVVQIKEIVLERLHEAIERRKEWRTEMQCVRDEEDDEYVF